MADQTILRLSTKPRDLKLGYRCARSGHRAPDGRSLALTLGTTSRCTCCGHEWAGELVRDALTRRDEHEQGAITQRLTVSHSHALSTLYRGVRLTVYITSPEQITAAEAREKAAAMFPPAFGGAA